MSEIFWGIVGAAVLFLSPVIVVAIIAGLQALGKAMSGTEQHTFPSLERKDKE